MLTLINFAVRENDIPAAGTVRGKDQEHRRIFDQHSGTPEAFRRQFPCHLDWLVRDCIRCLLFPILSANMAAAYCVHNAAVDIPNCVSKQQMCLFFAFLSHNSFNIICSILLLKRLVAWYYQRKLNKNNVQLNGLRAEKKKIIEKVMDKETYKVW